MCWGLVGWICRKPRRGIKKSCQELAGFTRSEVGGCECVWRAEDVGTSQKWTNSPHACGCSGKSNFVSLRGFIWPPGISHHLLPCAGSAGRESEHLEQQWGSFSSAEEAKNWMPGFGLGWARSGCWGHEEGLGQGGPPRRAGGLCSRVLHQDVLQRGIPCGDNWNATCNPHRLFKVL